MYLGWMCDALQPSACSRVRSVALALEMSVLSTRWILLVLVHVSADDSSCVLTLNVTARAKKEELAELDPELDPFNWDKRWLESYKEQVYALGIKSVVAKVAELAVGGLAGEFVSMFVSIFWPPPGHSKEEALLQLVMKWTEEYVGKEQAKLLRDLAKADLDESKDQLQKFYEPASAELLAAAEAAKNYTGGLFRRPPVFPQEVFNEAERNLEIAWGFANAARNKILDSSMPKNISRAQGIPTYIAATTLCLSLRRQLYNLTLLKDTWPHPWQGSSPHDDRIATEMKQQYGNYSQELGHLLIEAWKQWRFSYFTFTFDHGEGDRWAGEGRIEDKWLGKTFRYRTGKGVDRSYGERAEMMYQRFLFANELVPQISPFIFLQRSVPGWETRALSRGPLPEKLVVGALVYPLRWPRGRCGEPSVGG